VAEKKLNLMQPNIHVWRQVGTSFCFIHVMKFWYFKTSFDHTPWKLEIWCKNHVNV